MQAILDWGIHFIFFIQNLTDGLVRFFNFFTFLGDEYFYLLLFPLLYWCFDNELRLRVGVFFAISVVVNLSLKIGLHMPRPFWISSHVQLWTKPSEGFGLPSGHAQNAVVLWGTVAAFVRNRLVTAVVVVVISLIGISRIYLGVHFPTDVLAGWAIGGLLLMALPRLELPVVGWFEGAGAGQRLGLVFVAGLSGIGLGYAISSVVSNSFEIPFSWINGAGIQVPEVVLFPFSIAGFVTIMGIFSGLLGGHVWLSERDRFDPAGTIGVKFGRYVLGMIGVIVIWAGLDAAFAAIAADETSLGMVLRYLRYGSVGLWIGAFAPMMFKRIGLAL